MVCSARCWENGASRSQNGVNEKERDGQNMRIFDAELHASGGCASFPRSSTSSFSSFYNHHHPFFFSLHLSSLLLLYFFRSRLVDWRLCLCLCRHWLLDDRPYRYNAHGICNHVGKIFLFSCLGVCVLVVVFLCVTLTLLNAQNT